MEVAAGNRSGNPDVAFKPGGSPATKIGLRRSLSRLDVRIVMTEKELTLLIVILHDLDKLPELLGAWKEANVPGVTILQSAGGFHAEKLARRGGLIRIAVVAADADFDVDGVIELHAA